MKNSTKAILWGSLIAGTLDITGACVAAWLRSGVTPVRVLQSVASGLLGPAAYDGHAKTAVLGLVLHFFIAITWTVVFYLASRKWRFLIEQPIVWGLVYGVVVYAVMNFVVLQLSRFPGARVFPIFTMGRLIGLLIIMFCIGLPIALIVRRFSR